MEVPRSVVTQDKKVFPEFDSPVLSRLYIDVNKVFARSIAKILFFNGKLKPQLQLFRLI